MTTVLFLILMAAVLLFRGAGWLVVARRHLAPGAERKLAWLPAVSSMLAARAGKLSHARNATAVAVSALAGYLAVALVVFVAVLASGLPLTYYKIGAAAPGSAAHGVLEPGDRIIAVDGEPMFWGMDERRADLSEIVDRSGGRPLDVTYERAGARRSARLTPRLDAESGRHRLGVQLLTERTHDRPGPGGAAAVAATRPAQKIGVIAGRLLEFMTGEPEPEMFRGPVGIAELVAGVMQETMGSFAVYFGAWALIDFFLIDLGVLVVLAFMAVRARRRRRA